MAQHDYVIANGTGAAVRSDLNNALAAIVSQNSGATAPSPTYAYQFWADTTTGLLKLRNAANSAWITLFQLDGEWSTLPVENGTAAAPSIYFKDSGTDTGFYSGGTDQVGISTGGTARLTIDANGNVAVDTNTLYVDAPNNRVGIGTSSPGSTIHAKGGSTSTPATASDFISNATARFVVNHANEYGAYIGYANGVTDAIGIQSTTNIGSVKALLLNPYGGNVGIGTTSPSQLLHVNGGTLRVEASGGASHYGANSGGAYITTESAIPLQFYTNSTERARIDSSGRLLVGTSTSALETVVIKGDGGGLQINRNQSGNPTSGQALGSIGFKGLVSANSNAAAEVLIQAAADENHSGSTAGSRLEFHTKPSGTGPGSSPTERMRITQAGTILIGKTTNDQGNAGMQLISGGRASFATDGSECIYVNRNTNDGNLIELAQAGTIEGTISVSGTTVSYNGAHLSRWSQLPSGQERTEILRGSVLSNIDEMCEWSDEENEQLNRMKVSDVEGDKNVAGVFQAWDDDDDTYTNDFYCAMTGDFIIRIGAGVTVERGDLLMSAGDGTAKPQGDDIIRSKTIAKVTSTNVSCTYDDGSYCVPCVLMAC